MLFQIPHATPQLFVMFETSGHLESSPRRLASSLRRLDSIIHAMGLLKIDREDPAVTRFHRHSAPKMLPFSHDHLGRAEHEGGNQQGCSCPSPQISTKQSSAVKVSADGRGSPDWPENTTNAQLLKEEQRRLVWRALRTAAGCMTYYAALGQKMIDLKICKPWNVSAFYFERCTRALLSLSV